MFPAGFNSSGRGGRARERSATAAPFAEVERLDARLAELARGSGRARLVLGELLEALASRGGHHELGYSSLEAYARERTGQSGRWAVESRTLARRLAERPLLRAALAAGALGWCKTELVARHAEPDTEAELLALALGSTVRELRAHFARTEPDRETDEAGETCTLTLTLGQRDAWLFAWTRRFAEHVAGKLDTDELVSALLAEAFNTLGGAMPSNDVGERAWRAQLAEWRQESERRCEANFAARGPGGAAGVVTAFPPLGARELDARIAALSAEFAAAEVELARTALTFHRAEGARRLGYSTEAQYARERLGLSASSFRAKLTLARRLLAPVRGALARGELGLEAALAISRVATRETAVAWLSRARERTVKHLLEDVRAAELVRDLGGSAAPPAPETVRELHDLEGRLLGGARDAVLEAGSQMSARLGARVGRVRLRLRVTRDTARFFRGLEAALGRHLPRGVSFTELLCFLFWDAWKHLCARDEAYARVYARDRYTCSSPVCSRHDVTPHHIRFRSQGGSDEEDNVTALCTWCHLEGVHGGHIEVTGQAGALSWRFGGMEVRGRQLWREPRQGDCATVA